MPLMLPDLPWGSLSVSRRTEKIFDGRCRVTIHVHAIWGGNPKELMDNPELVSSLRPGIPPGFKRVACDVRVDRGGTDIGIVMIDEEMPYDLGDKLAPTAA